MILALAGGVGGAKLTHGLATRLPADELLVVVNTGDDFVHLGLNISPDLDTVMYWLAGLNDPVRGWGVVDETWNFMAAIERLGGPTWFKLGDRDLATHIERTRRLAQGERLSDVTRHLCAQLGVKHNVAPMSDDTVHTIVHTAEGSLEFQDYFVRRKCEPRVLSLDFFGAKTSSPSPAFDAALTNTRLNAIVICPSNPFLSIDPILALDDVRARIERHAAPVIAVSPIVGGQAIKGPAAKILQELGRQSSALEIARCYASLVDGIVIDEIDCGFADSIEALGMRVAIANTVMKTLADQASLASQVIAFAATLR